MSADNTKSLLSYPRSSAANYSFYRILAPPCRFDSRIHVRLQRHRSLVPNPVQCAKMRRVVDHPLARRRPPPVSPDKRAGVAEGGVRPPPPPVPPASPSHSTTSPGGWTLENSGA